MADDVKVGLVLSGGGAKGAYQVGVLRALAEMETRVDAISGASIGALNGAVLACAPSLETGVDRLEALWGRLTESPLSANLPGYVSLLVSAGLKLNGASIIDVLLRLARVGAKKTGVGLPEWSNILDDGLLSDKPLRELMDEYLDIEALSKGVPFYVSIYKSMGGLYDALRVLSAELGIVDTATSEFLHIQSLPAEQQKEVLLASAAIPLLFAPRHINDSPYSDGGQGGWQRQHGNTPITPLIESGCNVVIVTHLNDGSLWSRHDFPDTMILEIRPQSTMARDKGALGGAKDVLGFDSRKIPSWMEQGYEDTMHCIGRIREATGARSNLRQSETAVAQSEEGNPNVDEVLTSAMSRLK